MAMFYLFFLFLTMSVQYSRFFPESTSLNLFEDECPLALLTIGEKEGSCFFYVKLFMSIY